MGGKLLFGQLLILAAIFCAAIPVVQNPSKNGIDTSANPYRMTRFGWQDAREWRFESETEVREFVHPLWVSAAFVCLVVGVVVWSSEEDELAALFGRRYVELPVSEKAMAVRGN